MQQTLNVVIGLLFTFLLYSLFATAVRESIASLFGHRAKMLYKGIEWMLTDTVTDKGTIVVILQNFSVNTREFFNKIAGWFSARTADKLHQKFYDNPIIKNMGESVLFSKPSYIEPKIFSEVLIQSLAEAGGKTFGSEGAVTTADIVKALNQPTANAAKAGTISAETRQILQNHLNEAAGDINVFRSRLEQWYTITMHRVTGWYKRQTHVWLFGIGLFLAMSLNIDSIQIATYLSANPAQAQLLADQAVKYYTANPDDSVAKIKAAQAADSLQQQIASVNTLIGLGWQGVDSTFKKKNATEQFCFIVRQTSSSWTKFFGFLITAIAIGLGSPFWFDLLNKVVNLRATGSLPADKTDKNNQGAGQNKYAG